VVAFGAAGARVVDGLEFGFQIKQWLRDVMLHAYLQPKPKANRKQKCAVVNRCARLTYNHNPHPTQNAIALGMQQGARAVLDGIIPFWDPFEIAYKDECGRFMNGTEWSHRIGRWTRDMLLLTGAASAYARGTSIFYSGVGAKQTALTLSQQGVGTTIFDTVAGRVLNYFGIQNQTVWKIASWFYANTTGSSAIAVVGKGGGVVGTTLGSVEAPVLAARGVQVLTVVP